MTSNGDACPDLIPRLLDSMSLEVLPRAAAQEIEILRRELAPLSEVYIPFIASQDPRQSIGAIAKLVAAGFTAVPHIPVRNFESRESLAVYLAGAAAAGASRALLLAGDIDKPRGPYFSTRQVLDSELLPSHGFTAVGFAGHPEGHPRIPAAELIPVLCDKLDVAKRRGLDGWIVSQFCFEAEAILSWLGRLRDAGVTVPVRIGVAGPADIATLTRFALRCGVGASARALGRNAGLVGRLLGSESPDALMRGLVTGLKEIPQCNVEAIHLFPFGGLARACAWRTQQRKVYGGRAGLLAAGDAGA